MISVMLALAVAGSGGDPPAEAEDAFRMEATIRGIPDYLLPEGFDSLGILSGEGMYDDPVLTVLGHTGGSTLEMGSVPFPGIYNGAKVDWRWDENRGEVAAYSQMPFSAFCFCASYLLNGEAPLLELSGSWTEDPSAALVDSAGLLLERGDFSGAAGILSSVMYPGSYIVPGEWEARFLSKGRELGLGAFEAGSPGAGAAAIEDAVSSIASFSLDPVPEGGFASREDFEGNPISAFVGLEEYAGILDDYGLLLAASGRTGEAVPVLERVVRLAPGWAVARLDLADVLWESGCIDAAGEQYAAYIGLLEENGLMHDCPSRAMERAIRP